MTDFQRENRYVVIKPKTDVDRELIAYALVEYNLTQLTRDCVIVESDWPEYELVWQMIEARVTTGDNHIAISRHSKRLVEQLRTQLAERDKMLAEFACELHLAMADSQVRFATT